jgi:siroheme synthase (precorrin-2 oxidase/ferrochelatase)
MARPLNINAMGVVIAVTTNTKTVVVKRKVRVILDASAPHGGKRSLYRDANL